jgi:hypothetical protein
MVYDKTVFQVHHGRYHQPLPKITYESITPLRFFLLDRQCLNLYLRITMCTEKIECCVVAKQPLDLYNNGLVKLTTVLTNELS